MHYRALVVLLLRPADGCAAHFAALQRVRRGHDQAYRRWTPHITLIPPFLVDSAEVARLDELADALAPVCAAAAPHTLTLTAIGTFRLRRYHNIHLVPADAAPLAALQRELAAAAAASGVPTSTQAFAPHASLGQSYSAADKARIAAGAQHALGLRVPVDHVAIMYKPAGAPGGYDIYRELPLGRASPTPDRTDAPAAT